MQWVWGAAGSGRLAAVAGPDRHAGPGCGDDDRADQRRRFVAAVDLDPAVAVRALDDLALQACGASVGELDTFAVDADQAGGSTPLQDAVAGNVAVAQSRLLREPDGALRPFGQYRAITQEFQFATGQQAGLVNETHVFLTFVRPGTAVCR